MDENDLGTNKGWEKHHSNYALKRDILIATREVSRALRDILEEVAPDELTEKLDKSFSQALDGLITITELTDKI